jgi:hypothetical protein
MLISILIFTLTNVCFCRRYRLPKRFDCSLIYLECNGT